MMMMGAAARLGHSVQAGMATGTAGELLLLAYFIRVGEELLCVYRHPEFSSEAANAGQSEMASS